MCHSSISSFLPAPDKASMPSFVLFIFNQLSIIIGADEKREWSNGFHFTLGFLYLQAAPRKAEFKNGGFSASTCLFRGIFYFSELCTETVSVLWTLSIVDS
jgi:hypothetical protein